MSPPLHPAPEYVAACWIMLIGIIAVLVLAVVLAVVLPALL